jgi:6-phosphogluconolactonase
MPVYKSILLLLAITLAYFPATAKNKPSYVDLVIGTYSKQNSEGIYTTRLDISSGELTQAKLAFKSKDPTYLAVSKSRIIYAALREKNGLLAALSINDENQFSLLSQQNIWGDDPCYLSLSPNEQYIASANYNGGNVSIFKLSATGKLDTAPTILTHAGHSLNAKRQTSPHPHWVKWSPHNENLLYVIDLGTDKIMKYNFDYSNGAVSKGSVAFSSIPGAGPRHLVFHPTKGLAYILNELSNTIDLVKIETDGSFSLIKQASTLPKGYAEHNQAAHITVTNSGKYLYASNRGLNSIAVFNLNENGEMELTRNMATGGDWPRFFKLFDEYGLLLVANKNSNNIAVFKVQENGNLLKTSHQLAIDQPTFIDEY